MWGGLRLGPARTLGDYAGDVDTLVMVGGLGAVEAVIPDELVAGVRRVAGRARRVVGICTGAYVLAAAGLLDGRRVTTHWAFGDALADRYPGVAVDTDPIYIVSDRVWTSAGVTAGFDLTLAMVEADAGPELAREVAALLVLYLRRPGNQAQFSTQLTAQLAQRDPLRDLQHYIAEHPAADLSLAALAARVHMSPRHFARVFRTEVGLSPGRYVERFRLETARRLLESGLGVDQVVAAAGFGSPQAMRRAFALHLGLSPTDYCRRFGPRADLHLAG